MNIRHVIVAINQLHADGLVDSYAIGGAVGATFYLEPVATLDVDVFVSFHSTLGSLIVDPKPVYDHLKACGFGMEGEYFIIGGWPVQLLPATGALAEEALREAVVKLVEGLPLRVFTAEHLAAIALQTGRAKDKARLLQFIEAEALDMTSFLAIVDRNGLSQSWQKFERTFLT